MVLRNGAGNTVRNEPCSIAEWSKSTGAIAHPRKARPPTASLYFPIDGALGTAGDAPKNNNNKTSFIAIYISLSLSLLGILVNEILCVFLLHY